MVRHHQDVGVRRHPGVRRHSEGSEAAVRIRRCRFRRHLPPYRNEQHIHQGAHKPCVRIRRCLNELEICCQSQLLPYVLQGRRSGRHVRLPVQGQGRTHCLRIGRPCIERSASCRSHIRCAEGAVRGEHERVAVCDEDVLEVLSQPHCRLQREQQVPGMADHRRRQTGAGLHRSHRRAGRFRQSGSRIHCQAVQVGRYYSDCRNRRQLGVRLLLRTCAVLEGQGAVVPRMGHGEAVRFRLYRKNC